MSITEDLDKIKQQEQALRFSKFDEADAWALGCTMREAAAAEKLPLVIDIRIGIRPLFYAALPGTTPENPDWVRRKVNTVLRFLKSSYAVGLEYKSQGKAFDSSRGIDIMNYAQAGGGFPIHIEGTGVVGAITVSGLTQRDDHEFVVKHVCAFLEKDQSQLALGPDDP